ncbi:ArdC-like ssDNA-binding domain-containing protein [Deinococcus roseus]|uniref:LtrC n=1 Tax=Deinococcus roseus TaxID=392414 RepID=A0ABQ2DGT4_9DEIO|nr:ArdC-like ssDNA-binding domain-containing protein [Deinococcus roseus]GGJ55733.1 hypothetical protein GCM10008938_47410 [Deinococcus roseus]
MKKREFTQQEKDQYKAEKAAQMETFKTQCEQIFERLTERLKQGFSEELLAYLKYLATFHQYSYRNTILIQMQNPMATQVASYQDWKKRGRQVKKGEKGIRIMVPCTRKNPTTGEREMTGITFGTIFDVAQTEGQDLPTLAREVQGNFSHADLQTLVERCGYPVHFSDLGPDRGGYTDGKTIVINSNPARQPTPSHQTRTLIHEMAHCILHFDGVERSKEEKELEAEATAYAVCAHLGIDTLPLTANYLHIWSATAEDLQKAVSRVHKAIRGVLQRFEPQPEETPNAAD